MPQFHHRKLPDYSTLLTGRVPPTEVGFQSERLQIWYNNTEKGWADDGLHAHLESDECFIVLRGRIVVEVEGERFTIGAREFCCFPRGVFHRIVEVDTPVESLMIRAPSINDKIQKADQEEMV